MCGRAGSNNEQPASHHLQGLRQPSPDPEELEVAAFCMQWRRKLLRHRLREASDLDCDELGSAKNKHQRAPDTRGPGSGRVVKAEQNSPSQTLC